MSIFFASWWVFINIILLDISAGLLQKHTREKSDNKQAGLAAMLFLALHRRAEQSFSRHKEASLNRFILATSAALLLAVATYSVLQKELYSTRIFWLVLIAMPFYHLLYGLMGRNIIKLNASIRNFRLRSMLAIIIGANIILSHLAYEKNLWLYAVHAVFTLIAVAHIFYLCSRSRAYSAFYNLNQEDYDLMQPAFMNYLASLLEFLFYAVIIYFSLGNFILQNIINYSSVYIFIIYFFVFYVIILVVAKIFLVSRSLMSVNFYEERIVPLSFLFFGICYMYQSLEAVQK